MDSKEKARKKRMIKSAIEFQQVNAKDLLPHLPCLPRPRQENLRCKQNNEGPIIAADELRHTLVNYDNWFEQLIPALRELGHDNLADLLDDPADGEPDDRPQNRQHDPPNVQPGSDLSRPKRPSKVEAEASVHLQQKQPHKYKQTLSSPAASPSTGRDLESTRYSQLPCSVVQVLKCLDVLDPVFGNDWRGLAGQLGFSVDDVQRLQALHGGSPTEALLTEWSRLPDATLGKLLDSLRAMGRLDVCQQLEDRLGLQPEVRSSDDPESVASSNQSRRRSCSDMVVPHQPKVDPSTEVSRSKPANKSQVPDRKSKTLEGDADAASSLVERSEGTALSQRQSAASTQGAESGQLAEAGDNANTAQQEPAQLQNDCSDAASKVDEFVQGIGSDNQNTDNRIPCEDMKYMAGKNSDAPADQRGSVMPVNNLNRTNQEDNQSSSGSLGYDANCTGKTLLSREPGLSSSDNPSDSRCSTNYGNISPEDHIGPLRTNESMDAELEINSLQFSDKSCSTVVHVPVSGSAAGDAPVDIRVAASEKTATAESATAASAATSNPSPAASAPASGLAMPNEIQVSSQGTPVQQPSEMVRCLPDLHIPSVDGTFTEDDLVAVANPTHVSLNQPTSSQQPPFRIQRELASDSQRSVRPVHQQGRPDPGAAQTKAGIHPPLPVLLSDHDVTGEDSQVSGIRRKEAANGDGIQPASSQNHLGSTRSFSASQQPLPSTRRENNSNNQQPGCLDVRSSAGMQASTSGTRQSAEVSDTQNHPDGTQPRASVDQVITQQPLSTDRDKSVITESPPQHGPTNQDTQHNPLDAQSPTADSQVGTQSPLPPAQKDEAGAAEDPERSDDDDAGAAAKPQGPQTATRSWALPVLMSLLSAFSGGDLIPNTSH